MATKPITQNGVDFKVDDRINQYTGWEKKYTNGSNLGGSTYPNPDDVDETTGIVAFGINAVEIDWNGAKPGIGEGENGITTTGELLSSIKGVYSPEFAN